MQIGLEILEERLAGREAQAIADLREDIEQMAEMLNELLLFSRSGLEAARSAPRAVAVAATVNGILHTDCQNVLVRVDVPDELQVLVHAPLFRRALSNLLRNARHYAALSEGGIEVIARGEQGRVRIAVQDRGPGVPDYALAHLGEPFFRPERSRTRATGGFGLGLAIVRRCVEASGGAVAFRNRDGGGFEAELDLPAAIAP
jgi:two-component system sensor histidine kinase CpxA